MNHSQNPDIVILACFSVCIEWIDPYDDSAPYSNVNHIGIARIAIQTLTLDSDIALLEAQGVEFYSEPVRPDGIFGFLRFVCFEDPDGTIIELVQLL